MPVYEYKCSNCGRINEFLEGLSGNTAKVCSYCGSRKLVKRFSVFAPKINEGTSKRCYGCSDSTCPHSGR